VAGRSLEALIDDSWTVGLSAFVLQDEDAGDLEAGQEAEFVVVLTPAPAWTAPVESDSTVSSRRLEANVREFVGKLVSLGQGSWVMDVGILVWGDSDWPLVYSDREVGEVRIGDRFAGRGSLDAVAFTLPAGDSFRGIVPPRYTWQIDRIELDMTPRIEDVPGSWIRDSQKVSYRRVERTGVWRDDEGHADYLLHCTLVGTKA